jgi:hypothetical protein
MLAKKWQNAQEARNRYVKIKNYLVERCVIFGNFWQPPEIPIINLKINNHVSLIRSFHIVQVLRFEEWFKNKFKIP